MIQIEESNPSFESCDKCIYSDDSEEMCIFRRCIHAVAQLKECYVPKHPTIEPQRKKGKWIDNHTTCSECGWQMIDDVIESPNMVAFNFCPNCGADMREPEDIPMEYFESGGR